MTDGDGTVNSRSLVGCERFRSLSQDVFISNMSGANHFDMINYKQEIDQITQVLTSFSHS